MVIEATELPNQAVTGMSWASDGIQEHENLRSFFFRDGAQDACRVPVPRTGEPRRSRLQPIHILEDQLRSFSDSSEEPRIWQLSEVFDRANAHNYLGAAS